MAITDVAVVSIPVSDQDQSKAFYVDTLGFELLADTPMGPDMRWVQVRPPGGSTSLTLVTWFQTMAPGSSKGLVVECDDIDRTYKELQGRGVAFDGPIDSQPWGRFATFDDPDGNGIVLQQSSVS
jgi:catechol 2,3-dioxygenase-like lactoylglutathione lyase family enzyme